MRTSLDQDHDRLGGNRQPRFDSATASAREARRLASKSRLHQEIPIAMATLSVPVNEKDHIAGSANAPLTLVEYGDFQCPTCATAYPIVKSLQSEFGDRLRFVFRHYPLSQHAYAEPAAETAEFAADHERFWEMHDALFENQDDLGPDLFGKLAEDLRLDPKALYQSLDAGTLAPRVQADVQSGDDSDVAGTPTFFINGHLHEGNFDLRSLTKVLEAAGKS